MTSRALALMVMVAGCFGTNDTSSGIRPDAAQTSVDAAPDAMPDAVPDAMADAMADAMPDTPAVACTASPSYGNSLVQQFAGADVDSTYWLGRLDPSTTPDLIQLELYAGYGAFTGGIVPATIQIAGAETSFETCGACLFIFTDLTAVGTSLEITDYYFATSGTIDITSVTGRMQGTLTNVMLQHMVIANNTLVPANDGCVVSIPTMAFDAAIDP